MVPNRMSDDYLPCDVYQSRLEDVVEERFPRMVSFVHSDGRFYFLTLSETGDLLFRSEGYPNVGARAVGMKSVDRNRTKRGRYCMLTEEGRHYVIITAQNGEEIARSCAQDSEAAALALFPAKGAAALAAPAATDTPKRDDDYLVCSAYAARREDSPHPTHRDIIYFTHSNGKHYFAVLDAAGEIALRSEGYPTLGAREVGLKSVLRNRSKRERYGVETQRQFYYTTLKAQNGQEIGRSCLVRTEAAALAFLPPLSKASLALAERRRAARADAGLTPLATKETDAVSASPSALPALDAGTGSLATASGSASAGLGLAAAAGIGGALDASSADQELKAVTPVVGYPRHRLSGYGRIHSVATSIRGDAGPGFRTRRRLSCV